MTALHTFEEEPKRGTPARKEAETSAFIYSQFQAFFSLRERERRRRDEEFPFFFFFSHKKWLEFLKRERERRKKPQGTPSHEETETGHAAKITEHFILFSCLQMMLFLPLCPLHFFPFFGQRGCLSISSPVFGKDLSSNVMIFVCVVLVSFQVVSFDQ